MDCTENFASQVKNILVVGKNNQIGDMICSLPFYAALNKKFPTAKITLVAAKTNYHVPVKEINPYLEHVLVYDKSSLKTILGFYRKLRGVKYQIGIVPSTFAHSVTSHIINYLSGAKIRVGVKSIDGIKNKAAKYLNIKKDFYWDKEKKHQKERNLDVVRQLGCDLTREDLLQAKLKISKVNFAFAEKFFAENFPDRSKKVIGLHPGAGKEANIWQAENFIKVIKSLFQNFNNYVLITAGWTDKIIIYPFSEKLKRLNINFTIAENLEIKNLAAVLSKLDLYITNDTGTMHVAGSVGCKMISLFGPTKSYEWAPSMENQFYIQSETGNINDITAEEVLTLSEKILQN